MSAAITITEAHLAFGPVKALDGVSLHIPAGSCFGLVGESGSGKTTLMRVVLGLQRLDAGAVSLFGHPLRPGPSGLRLRALTMQAMLQDHTASLSPRRKIGQTLDEVAEVLSEPRRDTRARRDALFDRLGLDTATIERYPHQISGGQARRICLVRALLMRPRILFADEPTAGLDVSVQGDLLNLLQELRREQDLTLVVVSHDLAVVRLIAESAAVMHRGRIAEVGPAGQVFDAPQSAYAQELMAVWPRLAAVRQAAVTQTL